MAWAYLRLKRMPKTVTFVSRVNHQGRFPRKLHRRDYARTLRRRQKLIWKRKSRRRRHVLMMMRRIIIRETRRDSEELSTSTKCLIFKAPRTSKSRSRKSAATKTSSPANLVPNKPAKSTTAYPRSANSKSPARTLY